MTNPFIDKLCGLAGLTSADIAALQAASGQPRRVGRKVDLIREGDHPGPVFVLLEGWACRYKILPNGSRQVTAFLMPGDLCDLHVGVFAQMDHSIQTITPASVATIPGGAMRVIMEMHPNIARAMYVAQLIDEATLRAWIVSMGRRTSIERVAHLMCELYLRARNIGLGGQSGVELPLSQVILADALGMTPVHINRVLRKLREGGAMTLQRGNVTVLDPVLLVRIAGFDENYLHRRMRAAA